MDAQTAQLINSLGAFACSLPMLWGHVRLAPMRRPGAYIAVAAALNLAYCLARPYLPFWSRLGEIALFIVLPYAMYDAPRGRRALAVFAAFLPPLLCEALGFALWNALTGEGTVSEASAVASPTITFLIRTLFIGVDLILYEALARFTGRALDGARPELARHAALLPAAQLPVILALLYLAMFDLRAIDGYELLIVGYIALCLLVDLAIGITVERASRAVAARERSRVLEGQVAEMLAVYSTFSERVEAAARLRHDVRNHLQVAEAMASRGDARRAREYLVSVRKEAR